MLYMIFSKFKQNNCSFNFVHLILMLCPKLLTACDDK